MTFEAWWHDNWPRIKNEAVISEAQYMSCLAAFQACWRDAWNAALDATLQTDALHNASSQEVAEVEVLRTWVTR